MLALQPLQHTLRGLPSPTLPLSFLIFALKMVVNECNCCNRETLNNSMGDCTGEQMGTGKKI